MHYATRCPNCRTAFRVKADQLAAMAGKVRCGRCAYVFNALDHLLPPAEGPRTEFPAELAVPRSPGAPRTLVETPAVTPVMPTDASPPKPVSDGLKGKIEALEVQSMQQVDALEEAAQQADAVDHAEAVPVGEATAVATPAGKHVDEPEAPAKLDLAPFLQRPALAAIVDTQAQKAHDAPKSVVGVVDELPSPQLDLSALLDIHPPPPRFRWLWRILAILASLMLVMQCLWIWRVPLYKAAPESMGIWQTVCPLLKCRLPSIQDATALEVDNVELEEKSASPRIVMWSLELRNQASYPVALPDLQLTLTDTADLSVARKYFAPHDYLAAVDAAKGTLAAKSVLMIHVPLLLDNLNPAGYRVQAIYR
ncbi:DUF3426 domain-containing protein [Leeia oryzae]|uniref:DUF3426 domain-containing protein n=1 Tax=Leeia oryzae TaxID=356662 RepID=UPI0003789191|nr:DUF3426 domain-containing protein [Leeia oryzae]